MLGSEGGGLVSREDIMRRLELLRVEHRDLDAAIAALVDGGVKEITLLGQNVNAWSGEDDKRASGAIHGPDNRIAICQLGLCATQPPLIPVFIAALSMASIWRRW